MSDPLSKRRYLRGRYAPDSVFDWLQPVWIDSLSELDALPDDVAAVCFTGMISDEFLKRVALSRHITTLHVNDCPSISANGLEALVGSHITHIDLGYNEFDRSALDVICRMMQVVKLDLSACNKLVEGSQDSLEELGLLVNLETLCLDVIYCVADTALHTIARLRTLKHLSLDCCEHVTDEGVAELVKESRLEVLKLAMFTKMTRDGYLMLCQMPTLKQLIVSKIEVDAELADTLRKSIPKVRYH